MVNIKETVRKRLQALGFDLRRYEHSVPARRQAAFDHYGIDLLVDVGANIGQYATEARRNGFRRRILSIEPVTSAYDQLVTAATSDDLWDTRRCAVGAETGEITMHVSEGTIFSSALTVLNHAVQASPNAQQVADEVVPLERLDDVVPEISERVAVKIDVQGFERDVLDGAEKLLSVARYVEFELSPEPVYEGQMLMMEALARMADAGFVLSVVENLFRLPENGRSLQFNGIFYRP